MRSSSSSRAAATAAVAAIVALLAGCGSDRFTVKIDAKPDANAGQPFYVVVRSTEQAEYVTESYESVAARVFATPPDASVLKSEVVYPGETRKLAFDKPAKADTLGIYFLFTKPGEKWKTARAAPLPSSVDVEISGNTIKDES